MHSIKIKKTKLNLTPDIQTSPNGRPIRYSGLRKCLKTPEKWVNKVLKSHWIYSFRFMDEEGGYIDFYFDYENIFYKYEKRFAI